MRTSQNFIFFDQSSVAPQTSNVLVNSYNGSELILQVSGSSTSLTIKVFTKADATNGEFVETQPICLAPEMDLLDEISSNGIYSIGTTGIREIKLELISANGTVNVFGTISD